METTEIWAKEIEGGDAKSADGRVVSYLKIGDPEAGKEIYVFLPQEAALQLLQLLASQFANPPSRQ